MHNGEVKGRRSDATLPILTFLLPIEVLFIGSYWLASLFSSSASRAPSSTTIL